MKAFICIDDDNGILFNNRRLSKDKVLIQWIMDYIDGKSIWMRSYSQELFDGYKNIKVADDYLDKADTEDYCFVEDDKLAAYLEKADTIFVCRWNRRYPSDLKFENCLSIDKWSKSIIDEFKGSSHEKITIERWDKNVRN